jgi:hypothetical protein
MLNLSINSRGPESLEVLLYSEVRYILSLDCFFCFKDLDILIGIQDSKGTQSSEPIEYIVRIQKSNAR